MFSTRILLAVSLCIVYSALAANPRSCAQVKCGGGQCCNDALLGPICFDKVKYSCPTDNKGSQSLCGSGLNVCSGVCFNPAEYSCLNGVVTPGATNYSNPILPPIAAPASYPPQTADVRIINSCKQSLWIEGRHGPGGAPLPGQQVTSTLASPGGFVDYTVPATGLAATRFWAKFGCDKNGMNCLIGDSQQYWPNPPGGCPAAGCSPPVDSLFEATFGCKPGTGCYAQNPTTWFDTSQVDGWTLPYRLQVNGDSSKCDCDGTKCGFNGVDASRLDLARCPSAENLTTPGQLSLELFGNNVALTSVDLRIINKANQVIGCMSPCKKLNYGAPLGLGQAESHGSALWMCCPTPSADCTPANGCVTPEACRNGPVASTQYVAAVHSMAPGVYSYSYDDVVGLHACPSGAVTYTMEFCPNGTSYPLQL